MSEKRKLTDAEKAEIARLQMTVERLRDPDHQIDITVYDETDDEGQARMLIIKQTEAVMPPGWEQKRG